MITNQDGFARSSFQTALIAGSVGLVLVALAWLGGESILALVGADYVPAKTLMVLLMLGGAFELASASLRAAAYAMGLARSILRIHLLGIGTYLTLFYVFTRTIGLNGPGVASIMTLMLTLSLTVRLVAKFDPPEGSGRDQSNMGL
jgi:O-antigen/teichoic acid export membrane protein